MLPTRRDLVEMRLHDDAAEWRALVDRLEARRVLDIGAGLDALPEEGEFDLIVAPNDPFAGILDDAARAAAIANPRRLLARDGLLVIEGSTYRRRKTRSHPHRRAWPASGSSRTARSSARYGTRWASISTDPKDRFVARPRPRVALRRDRTPRIGRPNRGRARRA